MSKQLSSLAQKILLVEAVRAAKELLDSCCFTSPEVDKDMDQSAQIAYMLQGLRAVTVSGDIIKEKEEKIRLLEELVELQKSFFKILETVEESDDGSVFYPTRIYSCRDTDMRHLNNIFRSMKEIHRLYEGNS